MSAHWGRDTLCFKTKRIAGGRPAVAAGVLRGGEEVEREGGGICVSRG